jgi:hypothetical protein
MPTARRVVCHAYVLRMTIYSEYRFLHPLNLIFTVLSVIVENTQMI